MVISTIISWIQIIIAIILIGLILLQQRGEGGLGSAFGQSSGAYSTQRGIQKRSFVLPLF